MADIKCGVRVLPSLAGDFEFRNVQNLDAEVPTRTKPPPPTKKPQPPSSALKPISGRPPRPVDPALAPPSSPAIEEANRRKPPPPPSSALKPISGRPPRPVDQALAPPSSSAIEETNRRKPPPPPSSALKPISGRPPRPVDQALAPASSPAIKEANRSKPLPPTKSWLKPQAMAQPVDPLAAPSLDDRRKPLPPTKSWLKPQPMAQSVDPLAAPSLDNRHKPIITPRISSSDAPFEEPDIPKRPVPKPRTVKPVAPSLAVPPRRRVMSATPGQSFETDKVADLNGDNFEEFTQNMGKTLVLFYNSTQPNTAELTNEFSDAAERTQEPRANFGAVDCSQDQELCYREGACSTPMLKLFSDGSHLNCIKDPDVFKAFKMEELIRLAPAIIFQHWSKTSRPVPKPRKKHAVQAE